ncbi:MAG: hypothetical protein ACSHX3_03550 [Litorimonas sp.]
MLNSSTLSLATNPATTAIHTTPSTLTYFHASLPSPASDTRDALISGWRGFGGLDGMRVNAAHTVPSGGTIDDD